MRRPRDGRDDRRRYARPDRPRSMTSPDPEPENLVTTTFADAMDVSFGADGRVGIGGLPGCDFCFTHHPESLMIRVPAIGWMCGPDLPCDRCR